MATDTECSICRALGGLEWQIAYIFVEPDWDDPVREPLGQLGEAGIIGVDQHTIEKPLIPINQFQSLN